MTMFDDYTDIHIKVAERLNSITYPGPKSVQESFLGAIDLLVQAVEAVGSDAFMVTVGGVAWRGQRQTCVDGMWYRLRKTPKAPPTLSTLRLPFAKPIVELLMHPVLKKGGIVYVCGAPGQGKTHTASATLVSRLEAFGGVGFTIEDPAEMPLSGWHGNGHCSQVWINGDEVGEWEEAFIRVLRSQPVGTTSLLYVGEVRRRETALAMLRAANNGFLVIATGFGASLFSSLDALARFVGEENMELLGNQLRLVLHQRLGDLLQASVLVSTNPNSSVAQRIKNGKLQDIQNDILLQTNQLRMNINLWPEN